jgi:TonB family protein
MRAFAIVRTSVVMILTVITWGMAGSVEDAADRDPVPLHTPAVERPTATEGTGIAPEVTIKLAVDDRGRPTDVQILDVRPSSKFDELFAEAARKTLLTWRFAPALSGGEPRAAELQWTLTFPTEKLEQQQDEELGFSWRRFDRGEQASQDFRQRILALPLQQRAQLLTQRAETAAQHLNEQQLTKFTSNRFIVFTDAPKPEVAQVLAQNLEATFNILEQMLGIEPQPEPYRVVVFMYASESDFEALKRDVRAIEFASGFYNPLGLIAFHMQLVSNETLLGMMLHEATHAYLDRYVARPGVVLPRWLDEGFAEYLGNSQIRKKQLIPGKTRRAATYRGPWGIVRGKSMSQWTVERMKTAVRKNEALTIEELVSANLDEFYGERREQYYPMAWLLVHFLHHGETEWGVERFPTLLLYVAEGYPADEVLRVVYGDLSDLQESFRRYVLRF